MVSLQEQLLRDILKQPVIKVSNVAEGTNEIKKRLGSMKVLVVVDDIDDANQLDELAIEHESFGSGSIIIITTRDEHVLNIQKVDKKYKAQAMTKKEALELLSWHAFGNDYPDKEYIELARDIVDYCGGLPLALKVVGCLLAGKKSKVRWETTLDKLRNIPDATIYETLKLSYDRLLDHRVKGVFLDISCFFIGLHINFVTAILGSCFSVEVEITTLCDQCLLYIDEDEKLRMHDLIRDMGREIVREEFPVELGKRSRLWHSEDAKSVLRNKSGTEAVEGLHLFLPEHSDDEQSFSTKAFKKMWRLKFLELANVKLTGSYKHLSKELRLLSWIGFPLEAIPADFDQRNLVYLNLSNSKIVRVWEDSDVLPQKLKHLVLRDCHNLTELPDFSKLPHLKQLDLSGCKGLCGGYHFLAQLKMIEELALSDCNITDGAVLEIIGSLSPLKGLDLGGNGFNRLPILSSLSQLQVLYLNHCTNLQAIPDLPNSLRVLKANYCTALEILPDFSKMSKMWELELRDCRKLKDIPNLEKSLDYMDSIISIHMEGCTSRTDTFKENLRTKKSFGEISLCGNDIPNRLAYVAREDETLKFGATAAASSSSSWSSNRWKYEVFLSFRGEDTRKTFTGHLFIALRNAGINTFIDNRFPRGENIQSELDREIEGSRIAIIIFSKRYAESRWCLRELSMIMRCREEEGNIVYPIFYDVNPSEVSRQSGSFSEAFRKHESDQDPNEVKQWREDLKASADLAGWNLKTTADRREEVFIEKIVGDVKLLLKTTNLKDTKHSVGMAFRVQEFSTEYLDVGGSPDVQIIGIWGTGGIGKTTLAKAVCSKYQHSFSGQCYLEEVRSKKEKMVGLQEQLLQDILKHPDIKVSSVAQGTHEIKQRLRSMKVLVVVDGVDDRDQLDDLAIEHNSFGLGSRIIITTRDEHVLNIQQVDKRYKARGMTDDEAFEFLSWHAFGNPRPDKEYIDLARDVVDYCGGLPLALKFVGRLLATKRSKRIWESMLDKLRNIPNGTIHETLKLSYDGLHDDFVKGLFLDISCFFIEWGKDAVMAILDGCSRFSVEVEITTLCNRCLLDIDKEDRLRMDDWIRDMGREIVRAASPVNLGKRSRLWHSEDAKSVLRNESGTEAVEGLTLLLPEHSDDEQSFSTEAFKKMRRLKFLQLANVKLTGSYKHLSKELRLLSWIGFPLEAIPADFDQRNLVYLDLSYSKMVRVWEDSDLLPKKLKYLYLRHCHNLTELPDFSKLPHLKELYLRGCKGLCGGYHFLAQLKMIEVLELRDCNITDDAVLEIIGSLSSLRVLDLGWNGFNRLPILSGLSQLQCLRLNHCTNLQAIPDLPTNLIELDLNDIPNLGNSLDYMDSIRMEMEGCTSLNLQTNNAIGGIALSGNDIPNRFAYVADGTVKFEVPPSIDYIGGLVLGIVYSSDNSDCTEFLTIDVFNRTQRTKFWIWPIEVTVTASHEYYLWLGNLSNKKLNLKAGDMVLLKARSHDLIPGIKVNKTGVDIVKGDLSNDGTSWNDYLTMSYESDEDTDDDTQLSNRHVFLCYKTPEAWPWFIEGSESDTLPRYFTSALKARKNDITIKTLLTLIEGREGTEFSDGDVLIFPQMIKYRGLKESDVDSFVDDVLVNDKPWASGVQEPLTGPHVFICTHMSRNEMNRYFARVLIDKFKEEVELRGLTNQVFVAACFHTGGHNGNLIIYSPGLDGSITGHWYGYVFPHVVPELLDQHIGKGEIIERLWRGQMGASLDEAEKINDQKLPNGGESKKIKEKPQENGNQIQNNENFLGCCQDANSNGFTCCKEVSLEQNDGSEEKKVKETRESCAKKDALGKLSSLIGNWEQSDVLAAAAVVGAVATVAVAYSFYRRYRRYRRSG
ncbi:unnamed protein product [Malus baccata var. baccata]